MRWSTGQPPTQLVDQQVELQAVWYKVSHVAARKLWQTYSSDRVALNCQDEKLALAFVSWVSANAGSVTSCRREYVPQ